jgi:CheY-specific phosphatase CheX
MLSEVKVEVLQQIVGSVFETMMGLNVSASEITWSPGADHLTSFVQITGDWEAAVLLECSQWQACQFAGRILSVEPPEKVDDDVRDVLGELANMIGGNLKSEKPGAVRLSMPTVVDGSHSGLHFCGSKAQQGLSFQCTDGNFWVFVFEKDT